MTGPGMLQLLGSLAGTIAALALAHRGVPFTLRRLGTARWHRELRRVPMRAIAECADGDLVRFVGVAWANDPLLSPADGAECIYFRSSFDMPWHAPQLSASRYASRQFWLQVDDEWVWVVLGDPDAHVERSTRAITPGTAPAPIAAELAALTSDLAPCKPTLRILYVEERLRAGLRVAIVGRAQWLESTGEMSSAYRGAKVPRRVLAIVAPEGGFVRMSTDASML